MLLNISYADVIIYILGIRLLVSTGLFKHETRPGVYILILSTGYYLCMVRPGQKNTLVAWLLSYAQSFAASQAKIKQLLKMNE